jgi:two-component system cell cycle sensor histidine kinase/response regulator CckA
MSTFWTQQLDQVFVLYGAAFLLLGIMAGALRSTPRPGLAWSWLMAFGLVHGLHEWAEGLTLNLGDAPLACGLRHTALSTSFLLLLEFGRRRDDQPISRHFWMTMAATAVALLSLYLGQPDALRYGLGFPAALLSAHALWTQQVDRPEERRILRLAALLLTAYGLLAGLIVPSTYEAFARWAGAPVQVYRMLAIAGMAACIWRLTLLRLGYSDPAQAHQEVAPLHVRSNLLLMAGVLSVGCMVTHQLGRQAAQEQRRNLLNRAQAVAASLNAEHLELLTGQPEQEMTRPHQQVVRALTQIRRLSPDLAQVYLYALHESNLVFYASAMTDQPDNYYPAGEPYEGELEDRDIRFFEDGAGYVAGPFRDRWGHWVSATAPALWSEGGRIRLALGMDIPAADYARIIRVYRSLGLLLSMGLTLLVMDFFNRQRRSWLVAQRLAGSESRLRNLSEKLETRVQERTAELAAANTALHQEATAHRVAELKLRTLTDQLPVITYTVALHPQPHTTFISPQLQPLLGYRREEWLADPDLWIKVLHPDDRARVIQEVQSKNLSGDPFDMECRHVARDGSVRWFRNTARFQFDEAGRPLQVHGVMLDITDRIQAAHEVRETGERYRLLFEQSPVGVFHFDRERRVTRCNPRFAAILHSSEQEWVGSNLHKLGDDALLQAIDETLRGRSCACDGVYQDNPRSAALWISLRTAPILDQDGQAIGGVGIVEDIGGRRREEEERAKSQKLESLGLLAGGIAHDFNNILTSILGNISMLRLSGSCATEENGELLADAEQAAKRAKDLTQQLLTFAKGGAPVKKLIRLGDLIRETVSFALHGSRSRSVLEVPDDLWAAEVDPGQLAQVVQNLVINADQAMPEGGTLTVRAANHGIREPAPPGLPAGAYLKMEVEDTGIGISAKHLERIFDPYFTTKSKGSGLGLTTSFSIIRKHGGSIAVASEPGRGTCFTLYLPARENVVLPRAAAAPAPEASTGQGHLLVMDDEPAIRDITQRMLRKAGYETTTAAHGEEAIRLYQAARDQGRPFRAVILDLTIPGGLGGRETFLRLKAMDPAVCALVASGYSDETLAETLALGFSGVVPKPFTANELVQSVHAVLKRPPSRGT